MSFWPHTFSWTIIWTLKLFQSALWQDKLSYEQNSRKHTHKENKRKYTHQWTLDFLYWDWDVSSSIRYCYLTKSNRHNLVSNAQTILSIFPLFCFILVYFKCFPLLLLSNDYFPWSQFIISHPSHWNTLLFC